MLNRRIRSFREDEGGFTLIELLVVILIIGILAAVALPTFLNQGKKGADAAAQSDLQAVATKVEACATQTNDYTTCLPSAGSSGTGTASDAPTLQANMTVQAVTASTYTLVRDNPKGSDAGKKWRITSSSGNVASPVGAAS